MAKTPCKCGSGAEIYSTMAEEENVTEQLKIDDPSEWVAHMNNIHVRAIEIVNTELIYA